MPLAFKTHRKLVQVIGKSYMNSNPLTKPPENTENVTGIIFQLLFVCVCVWGGGGRVTFHFNHGYFYYYFVKGCAQTYMHTYV